MHKNIILRIKRCWRWSKRIEHKEAALPSLRLLKKWSLSAIDLDASLGFGVTVLNLSGCNARSKGNNWIWLQEIAWVRLPCFYLPCAVSWYPAVVLVTATHDILIKNSLPPKFIECGYQCVGDWIISWRTRMQSPLSPLVEREKWNCYIFHCNHMCCNL
jgi:hypothetical protein